MMYRNNSALAPMARSGRAAKAEMLCEGIASCAIPYPNDTGGMGGPVPALEPIVARALLDEGTGGWLGIIPQCVRDLPRDPEITDCSPVGSGRTHAQDRGGRIVRALLARANHMLALSKDGTGQVWLDDARKAQRRDGVWALAYPLTARAMVYARWWGGDPTPANWERFDLGADAALVEWDIPAIPAPETVPTETLDAG